jgi:hypothetical protein
MLRRILLSAVALCVAYLAMSSVPDLKRYLRIRAM